MSIRLILYDDNEPFRLSLEEMLLELPDLDVVCSRSDPRGFLADLSKHKPDIVVMDIDMPYVNGVEAVRNARQSGYPVPVIMLTVFDDDQNIFEAVCAGASGYILKSSISEQIPSAFYQVLSGGAPMTGSVAKRVLQMLPQMRGPQQAEHELSKREVALLKLLVDGYSYKMSANELGISIDTVRSHIRKIYEKLQVHSATEAVSTALRKRII